MNDDDDDGDDDDDDGDGGDDEIDLGSCVWLCGLNQLAENRVHAQAYVNMVVNSWIQKKSSNFLTSFVTAAF